MTVHVIEQRDWFADAPRRIVWDDETGEVSGEHHEVPTIRRVMAEAARDGGLRFPTGYWRLRDPRRDPNCFAVVLKEALWASFDKDALPAALVFGWDEFVKETFEPYPEEPGCLY